jgi:hypothetical protein
MYAYRSRPDSAHVAVSMPQSVYMQTIIYLFCAASIVLRGLSPLQMSNAGSPRYQVVIVGQSQYPARVVELVYSTEPKWVEGCWYRAPTSWVARYLSVLACFQLRGGMNETTQICGAIEEAPGFFLSSHRSLLERWLYM